MNIYLLIIITLLSSCNDSLIKNDFYILETKGNQVTYTVIETSEIGISHKENGHWSKVKPIKIIPKNNSFKLTFTDEVLLFDDMKFKRYHDYITQIHDGKLRKEWVAVYSEKTLINTKEEKDDLGFSIWIRKHIESTK